MKKRLIIILAVFSSYIYPASEEVLNMCSSYKVMAVTIMTNRQNEVDMSAMIEIAMNGDPIIQDLTVTLIVEAYEEPSYSSESYKEKAISEFANKVYLGCFKTFKDQ